MKLTRSHPGSSAILVLGSSLHRMRNSLSAAAGPTRLEPPVLTMSAMELCACLRSQHRELAKQPQHGLALPMHWTPWCSCLHTELPLWLAMSALLSRSQADNTHTVSLPRHDAR